MKRKLTSSLVLLLNVLLLFSCEHKPYDPNALLTTKEEEAVMKSIIRYLTKAPENTDPKEIFSEKYDAYYAEKMKTANLELYAVKNDSYFFLVTQPAPSLIEKRHATGGRFKLNDGGEFTEYEEIFRTWKMIPDTLQRRSFMLFDKMVKGESLQPFEPSNSKGEEYIEFPDERNFYSVEDRAWKVK
jgi:hypothetical protein